MKDFDFFEMGLKRYNFEEECFNANNLIISKKLNINEVYVRIE